jgi:CTP:molybdopterin cytidylyltransferase MocA
MSSFRTTSAIVLAAGRSRRMGRFKPLMALGGRTVLQRVLDLFAEAGITDVIIVTGYRSEDVRAAVASPTVRCVDNVRYDQGMFSSLLAGIRFLSSYCRRFFVLPVDIPLVSVTTLGELILAHDRHPDCRIVYPVCDGRRGHPPLIDTCLVPEILQWDGQDGLRGFLGLREASALDVRVDDEAVLLDLDTLSDHRRLEAMLAGRHKPIQK